MIAYIDPGVGTMIVQFIAAFFVGSALYFQRFFGRVIRFVFRFSLIAAFMAIRNSHE